MNEILYISGEQQELSKYYRITNEQDDDIGTVEGYISKNGELVTVVKVYHPDFNNKGIGTNAFNKIFKELNEIIPVETIKGSWHRGGEFQDFADGMSTNMQVFLKCREAGKNQQECALLTPTGKWAKKLGFTIPKVLLISKDDIYIDFIK